MKRGRVLAGAALAAVFWMAVAGCGQAAPAAAPVEATIQAASEEADAAASETAIVETAAVSETEAQVLPETAAVQERTKVKGIYVTGAMAGTANMDRLIDLVDRTELNAMVIDIKNDDGRIVCEMDAPVADEIGAERLYVKDMPGLVAKCKEKGIYLIARIVAFKDPFLAEARPEWSLHNADGSVFRDKDGLAWVNPYEPQVWNYLAQISLGAAALGFDEIQYDYVRFSTDRGMKQVDFGPAAAGKSKTEAITEFVAYVSELLHTVGVSVSADVYGVVIDSAVDQQIVGQDYLQLTQHLDAISPMIYPSHYGPYNYNIPVPDAQPYDTVLAAMQASRKVLAGLDPKAGNGEETVSENSVSGNGAQPSEGDVSGNGAQVPEGDVSGNGLPIPAQPLLSAEQIAALPPLDNVRADVRPWLQDFTATWVKGHIKYGPEQIRAQIQAVYDAGYDEWILWNAANRYTEGGLLGADMAASETTENGGTM